MAEWTFVTNHAVVLSFVAKNPQITAREMAEEIGVTERAVRKILSDLQSEKYLRKKREGRRVRYSIRPHLALRHRTQRDKLVGDLLKVLGWRKETIQNKLVGKKSA
jgi:DNA-binding IclR family transcriptional regulator